MTSIFNKLFRRKTSIQPQPAGQDQPSEAPPAEPDEPTAPPIEQAEVATPPTLVKPHLETQQLLVGVGQSVGIQRDNNEDALFTLTTNFGAGEESLYFGLYIIADGMGGHENGELASSLAVGQLTAHVINTLYLPVISGHKDRMDVSIQEVMNDGVVMAHHKIKQVALGGGTTLTAALIIGGQITIAHIGDSRAYMVDPQGNLQLLTHDHSLVKRLEEIGQISAEQASIHPQRNVLYRALGQGELFTPDISTLQVQPGSHILICTDGLWGVITEKELVDITRTAPDPQSACQSLIYSANAAGGPDNISVIIIYVPE